MNTALPKVMFRTDDGERFLLNDDGKTYSMESSEMHSPHKWSYKRLVETGAFKVEQKTKGNQ